jgi:hypothetical protein
MRGIYLKLLDSYRSAPPLLSGRVNLPCISSRLRWILYSQLLHLQSKRIPPPSQKGGCFAFMPLCAFQRGTDQDPLELRQRLMQ